MLKKGILKAWHSATYTATVQIAGSSKAYLEGVKVARILPALEMLTGRCVVVCFFDLSNASDAVVVAVYA
jgi:hypothetical protein